MVKPMFPQRLVTGKLCTLLMLAAAYLSSGCYGVAYTYGPQGPTHIATKTSRLQLFSADELARWNGYDGDYQYADLTGFETVAASQEDPEWCWAAAVQMVLAFNDVEVEQREIVRAVFGETTGQGSTAGTTGRILRALTGFVQGRAGEVRWFSPIQLIPRADNAFAIVDSIESGYPLIIGLRPRGNSFGHIVVVTGVSYYEFSPGVVALDSLEVFDPAEGGGGRTLEYDEIISELDFVIVTYS